MLSLRPRMHASVLQKPHRARLALQSWRSSSMRWCRWRTMAWTAQLTSQTLSLGLTTFCVCQPSMHRGRLLPLNQVWPPTPCMPNRLRAAAHTNSESCVLLNSS